MAGDDILRIWREPGEHVSEVELDEAHCLVIGEICVGDWAFLPEELGGGRRRIVEVVRDRCLLGGADCGSVKHYLLDGDDGLAVAECEVHKFAWYLQTRSKGGLQLI